ncbi:heat shock 70 kDa protein 12A [Aspergillus udagawae]|nr:heat shock 70 kDa protein 12A [Aspergillus udagawae]
MTNKPVEGLLKELDSLALIPSHRIIVGVDYGTTFTGASYVSTKNGNDLNDIVIISSWPGPARDVDTVVKAPSRIAYTADNPSVQTRRWGYQVQPGMTAYSWTKLLLDQDIPLTKYDDSTLEDASSSGILKLPEGKTAVEVVADYLSEVYQHILRTIAKQITEETLSITPLEFWFTVPAIWSDQAQSATRRAAQIAGFGSRSCDNIFMISEPEAAAIAALRKYTTHSMGGSVRPDDGVLVCDCGGGTVDITTYLVETVKPELTFGELCTGIGGKCGSTAVDRNLYQLMSERFGDAFDDLPMKLKGPGSRFMKAFESIKRDFGYSDEENVFELPLNMKLTDANPEHFNDDERLVLLSSADLQKIFRPVVQQILKLVRQQIKAATAEAGKNVINRIILAGGFGDSEYLRSAFKRSFWSTDNITITVPDNPQAAIVQGAALRGLEGLRSSTKRCRRNYGWSWSVPFREGQDQDTNACYDRFTGKKLASGVMKWMITKGEIYAENHVCTASLFRSHLEGEALKANLTLYSSDLDHAPERVEHPGVRSVGNISVDFTELDLSTFERKSLLGTPLYKLQYDVNVVFGAQEGVLKFEAVSQGKVVGKTSISFHRPGFY